MPNLKTSIKDLRSSKRREVNNDRLRVRTKKAVKKFKTLVAENNTEEAKTTLKHIYKVLDKAAKKNVIKDNKADRLKGRLTKNLNKLTQNNVQTAKKSA
jgi:small subunit ribosomal protein S20